MLSTEVRFVPLLDLLLQTSNAVASVLYQLALHQDKQAVLQEEISKILPKPDAMVDNEKLEQMAYLKACIKETMR